jgi:hypothetical protein
MKEKFLPWFLLFCALGLSGTAAYYSVVGLSVIFVGVALPVIIMGSFLEISKIAIATYLHDKWKVDLWCIKNIPYNCSYYLITYYVTWYLWFIKYRVSREYCET